MVNVLNNFFVCIDLKSFYASVECVERGLDPLTTNLVVADLSRSEKTICLAVTPSLKKYGIPGRLRLFDLNQKINEINKRRLAKAKLHSFKGTSTNEVELSKDYTLKFAYIVACPRMSHYIIWSTKIYKIYLKYVAKEDIHVYSIDEVFIDLTKYLKMYNMPVKDLVSKILNDIYQSTHITATAGIGTNMYLAKVAMDIMAKHIEPDANGVRVAFLDEISYRKALWHHTPLTDFWRIGKGYEKRLNKLGIKTMGDVARCSLGGFKSRLNEDLLYQEFGVNAELLIDHAWGYEPTTIKDIKNYKPERKCLGSGQVLKCPYNYGSTKLVVKEMVESLVLTLVSKCLVTNEIVLSIRYNEEKTNNNEKKKINHASGNIALNRYTSSHKIINEATLKLFERIINKKMMTRRIYLTANNVISEEQAKLIKVNKQLSLFDYEDENDIQALEEQELVKERLTQETIIRIKSKFGKNAIIKGRDLEEGATTKERNTQIGGHKE